MLFFNARLTVLALVSTCLLLAVPVGASRAEIEKAYLSAALQDKLAGLPYGLSGRKSLLLRFKHVETVRFMGAGTPSRFSFKRGQSILPEGMSLRLLQDEKGSRANAIIQLRKPLDVRKYNSVAVWVWTSIPNMRLQVRLKGKSQVQTSVIPSQGFPPNEPVQLVIPFARFFPENKLDQKKIQQIILEFGQDSVGNSMEGAMQILGVAFIEQTQPLKQAVIVLGRTSVKVVSAESAGSSTPDSMVKKNAPPAASSSEKNTMSRLSAMGRSVRSFLGMSETETAEFFKDQGLDIEMPSRSAPPSQAVYFKSDDSSKNLIATYSQDWPSSIIFGGNRNRSLKAIQEKSLRNKNKKRGFFIFFGILCFSLWVSIFFLLRRKEKKQDKSIKVMHEVLWPFSITQPLLHKKVEREFWRGVATQEERMGWLSTTGLVLDKTSPSAYFGEPFLRRQIGLANRAGMKLFPSLSFTNSIFRKDVNSPNLEWSSVALRSLVIDTLQRFAEIADGVRVERAVELLDPKLRRNDEHEFWTDVISAVKAKKPGFLFIADAVGDQSRPMRDVGFDLYENDLLVTTIVNQIEEGRVGDLQAFLKGKSARDLKRSIYSLSSLVRPSKNELERHQKLLAAILLTLLPGIIQHDNNLPDDLAGFVGAMSRSLVVRNGNFVLLQNSNPAVLSFVRWVKKSMVIAVVNMSQVPQSVVIKLDPLFDGIDNNKLYLFENALHGSSTLKNLLNNASTSGPALALWGQNLRETGLPLTITPMSLAIFSVSLTKPLSNAAPEIASDDVSVPAIG